MIQSSIIDNQWSNRLNTILPAIDLNRSLDDMLPDILNQALETVGLSTGWIFLKDNNDSSFYIAATAGLPAAMEADDHAEMRWGPCECQTRLLNNKFQHPGYAISCKRLARVKDKLESPKLSIHISYPMRISDRVIGLMNLAAPSEPALPLSMRGMGLLANQLAVAVDASSSDQDVEWMSRLQKLEIANRGLIDALALDDDFLQRAIDHITEFADARYGALALLDRNGQWGRFFYSGVTAEQAARIGHQPHGSGILGTLLREGETLNLTNLNMHPESAGIPAHHPPMKSFIGVPILKLDGRPVGRIYLTDKQSAPKFNPFDQTMLEAFSQSLAIAIELQARDTYGIEVN